LVHIFSSEGLRLAASLESETMLVFLSNIEAMESIKAIKEEAELRAFKEASKSKIRGNLIHFIEQYPNSRYLNIIQKRLSTFKTKTLTKVLILPYDEFGLSRPMSGAEAKRKFAKHGSFNLTMPSQKLMKRADKVIVLHRKSKFPDILKGTVYGGKLHLIPARHHFPYIKTPPGNSHIYYDYSFNLLLPVGTTFIVPKDQWIQWNNVEIKGGELKLLEAGIELSKGMEVILCKE
jgi:hypothetical protein